MEESESLKKPERKSVPIMEILRWQDQQAHGFNGILTNPNGQRGFLSKIEGGTSWTPIGEGQDPGEVMDAARKLHDAHLTNIHDSDYLRYLSKEIERLSKPKPIK